MLKPRTGLILAALILLSACQVPLGTAGTPKPKATSNAAILAKPSEAASLLAGKVEIDAHYLIGTGKGKLIGTAAGNVVAAGGGNLLGSAAGNLIGPAAGNLIGTAAGNLIGKRKYGVAATPAAKTQLGETLPAAEMEIQVFDMASGKPLTLGVDPQGKAVLSIFTNAGGGFQVYLPTAIGGKNVRVVATVPDTADTRLAYHVVTSHAGADAGLISEDTAVVSAFLREAFVSRLERLFEEDLNMGAQGGGIEDTLPASMAPLLTPMLNDFKQAVRDGQVASLSAGDRKQLARKTADVILAYVELDAITMEKSGTPVLDTLVGVLKEVREGAMAKMRASGAGYFAGMNFLQEANESRPGQPPYEIKKPADLNDFVLRHVMAKSDRAEVGRNLHEVLASVGVPLERRDVLNEAMDSLLKTIGITMMTNAEAKAKTIATIKAGLTE